MRHRCPCGLSPLRGVAAPGAQVKHDDPGVGVCGCRGGSSEPPPEPRGDSPARRSRHGAPAARASLPHTGIHCGVRRTHRDAEPAGRARHARDASRICPIRNVRVAYSLFAPQGRAKGRKASPPQVENQLIPGISTRENRAFGSRMRSRSSKASEECGRRRSMGLRQPT